MTASFEVDINGRTRTIAVERVGPAEGGRFHVNTDGRIRVVDARRDAGGRLSLLFPEEGGASHDVALVPSGPGELTVHLAAGSLQAVVNGRRARRLADAGAVAGEGEQRIAAPMPGRVVRVLVAPGDEVSPRQPLVVVEAMKMENELSASRAGRVKDVQVREGTSVEAGKLLVIVG
ncbi:MAG: biotin/lipoyl-containing protein [Vicinamibacterales bacterium]